jgi:hypothetical protein
MYKTKRQKKRDRNEEGICQPGGQAKAFIVSAK